VGANDVRRRAGPLMPLAAAIVGFGGMGQRHYRACENGPCEVVAICDWNPSRVFDCLPSFAHDRVFSDHRALFDAYPGLDVVSVASNGPTHAAIAIDAMERGVRRVLIEKPVATSLEDADRVSAIQRRTGARVAVNHVKRWSADYAAVKRLIRDGVIGRLRHISFTCGSTGLGNYGTHAFDLMRFLFDAEPATAVAWLDRTGTPNPRGAAFVDPGGFGVLVFDGGQRGFVEASEDTGVQYLFSLVGEYGRIIVDELNGEWTIRARTRATRSLPFTRYGAETERVEFEPSESYDLVALTRRAILELAGDGPVRCTPDDGRRSLEMVVAFHESDAAGHVPIALPLGGAALTRNIPIG
jgi:predicted dehydrogenase